jgi:imidazolonepropionase-like amidohydrolase
MLTSTLTAWTSLGALATAIALSPAAHASDKIAIKVGRIITQAGPDILNGVIVIENGKIRYVGNDPKQAKGEKPAVEEVPWDADVLDHPELIAFPGFVEAHSFRGMDRPNENIEVAPFLDVRDSIDPISFYFEDSLRSGITTINIQQGNGCVIGAQGMVVKPSGITIEQMLVKTSSGLKISASPRPGRSRALQAQALRRAFTDLRQHLDKLVQDKKDGKDLDRREALYQGRDPKKEDDKKGRAMEGSATWKVAGLETIPRGEVDEKEEPLLRLVEGKIAAFVYCDGGVAVELALEIARANGFLANTALVLDGDSWKAADIIAESGVPVILSPNLMYVERDPVTGKEVETFVPSVFKKKNVRFALQSLNTTAQSLWYQAALCVGYGVDRQTALDAVTSADILHLGKRLGSIEVGKDGNVLLLSGDPLSVTTTVNYVVLEGKLVYDRSKDVRTKHLIEGVEPQNTAPGGADAQAKPHDDDDETKDAKEPPKEKDAGEKKPGEKSGKNDKKDSGKKE